ncbi:ATP-grasp domain-containing protein [Ectothiorhodospiraceae bacterium 2226]|nr:ATP-grasp domain-containing protein [Ectothiorhodospiraceae bacterium 2226]
MSAALRRGAEVLVASEGRHSLVAAYAQGLHIDFSQPDAALRRILEAAERAPFAGVLGLDDASLELAARACRALGLPHNPPEAARLARRKDLARARLAAAGVRIPPHRVVDLTRPLVPQAADFPFPAVIKPVAMSGSRGVMRVDTPAALEHAGARLRAIVREAACAHERATALLERFVPGVEVALEGLLEDGELRVLAVFDKPDPLDGPFFEETYYVTPSRHPIGVQQAVAAEVARACAAYGLRHGPVHAECRVNDEGVWLLEVAARTIGGLCGRLLRWGTGMELEDLVLGQLLGSAPESAPPQGGAGVLMLPTPRAGVLRRVSGVLAALKIPYVEDVVIEVREGYTLTPLPEGASYLGFVFARAPSAAEAEAALRAAQAVLHIEVAPLFPVASRA